MSETPPPTPPAPAASLETSEEATAAGNDASPRSPAENLDPYVPLIKELTGLPTDDYNWLKSNLNRDRRPEDPTQAGRYDEMTTKYADLIKRIKLHIADDPAHTHNVFANADDDIKRKKTQGELGKFAERMSRALNVADKYAFEQPKSVDRYGNHYGQLPEYAYGRYSLLSAMGVLAYNLMAGTGGLIWNWTGGKITGLKNSQSGRGNVAREKTVKEQKRSDKDAISSHREFIYTGGNFSGVGSREQLNPDKLKKDNWIVRFLTKKPQDWHRQEDSYLGKGKLHKSALTKPAEYGRYSQDRWGIHIDDYTEAQRKYDAHKIEESWKNDKKHNPNFQAVLKALSEIDPDNPPDHLDFQRQIQADSATFRQSGDTKHLEEQVEKHLRKLQRQLPPEVGAEWDRYMRGNGDAPIATGMSILQTMVDEKKRLDKIKEEAAEGEKAWRKASEQVDTMFDENEFEIDGKRRYFTKRVVRGSELPPDRREVILKGFDKKFNEGKIGRWEAIGKAMQRKDGDWDAADAAVIAVKGKYRTDELKQKALEKATAVFNTTDFVEYTVHIYNPDGTVQHDETGNDLTAQGQVVAYADSRTGGIILCNSHSLSETDEFSALLEEAVADQGDANAAAESLMDDELRMLGL